MDKKLKIFGIVACVIIAMSLGIIWEQFLENFTEEKLRYEFLDLKNKMLSLKGIVISEISECKNYSGGGTYKINEGGSITFIESAKEVGGPQWQKRCKHENCSMRKFTANDSLPIVVNNKDYGYAAGRTGIKIVTANDCLPIIVNKRDYGCAVIEGLKIFKNNSTVYDHFNETEIK